MKRFSLLFLFCVLPLLGFSQFKFSSDPAQFPADVNTLLSNTKNANCIAAASEFAAKWSSFSSDEQKKIIETTQRLGKSKRLRVNPHYADYFSILVAAKNRNMPSADIDTLLQIADYVVQKYQPNQLNTFFPTVKLLLEKGMLYSSSYNRLYVTGGSFRFGLVQFKEEPVYEIPETTKKDQEDEWGDGWGNPKDMDKKKEDFFSDWDQNYEEVEEVPVENVLDVGYMPPPQPPVDGAIIVFENVDFIIATAFDSAIVKGTSGSLMLKNNQFVGKGGVFDWSVAGFNPGAVTTEFKDYNFFIKSPKLTAEGVVLKYPEKCDKEVEGVFEYNSKKHKSFDDINYPRFKSFNSNIDVKGLGENIKYHGGLSLSGRKIYSSSLDEGSASIEILREGTTKIKARSPRFELSDSTIAGEICSIVLYQGEDSIYHPGANLKYNKNRHSLRVSKTSGFKHAPFLDSYHKIEIVSDQLTWDMNSSKMDFNITNAREQIAALFESEEYFNGNKYSAMQGMYKFHPLQIIVAYADKNKNDYMVLHEVAKSYKIEPNTLKGAMMQLMKTGFIDFNPRTGDIKLRKKARHYVLSRRDKKDYDNITFVSIAPGGSNATLDLETNELVVRGVDRVYISDSLSVNFVPDNRELKILKNRDVLFNGKINTQNFQFVGTDFTFRYDTFLVRLNNIDQIRLAVEQKDKGEKGKARVLGNELRYSSGVLYINKPDNKSGRRRMPEYPIFDAATGATVFFNKPEIASGAYDTTLQFKIPPFKVDSLSSKDPQSIGFDGEFSSGGIFPKFKEKLVVMPDMSLGFEHKVPKDGYQLYEGHGKYYKNLSLNNQGLRGDGEIHFLNTTLWSKDFVFFIDSVLTEGHATVTKPGTNPLTSPDVTFPEMKVNEYRMKWLPKRDSMYVSNVKEPIMLYDNTAQLEGTTIISTKGMNGMGVLFTRGSESESKNFHFEQTRFAGREANFEVKSDNPDKPALSCDNVKLDFDLEKSVAYFSPEIEGAASNEFPYAQYKSSLDKGEWDLQKKKIFMKMPEGGDINKSYFYSTRKDQDSLVFNATDAVYDIEKLTLNINGIPYIKVADGKIFPKGDKVTVEENAVIRTLKDAKIELDTITKYHHLYNGTIDILGRKKFAGEATYQYVNLGSDTLSFKFQDFRLVEGERKKDGAHTVATGAVREEDSLEIAPKILYKGKITMYAQNKNLAFDGYVKLNLKGALSYSQWLKYQNPGDKNDVVINIDQAVADNGTPLTTGMHFDKGYELYTTFISQKRNKLDKDIFITTGILEYNADTNEFRVGKPEKLANSAVQGSLFKYNDTRSETYYSGKFNLIDENPNIKLIATGIGGADLNVPSYDFNTLLSFDFKLNSAVLTNLSKHVKTTSAYTQPDSTETFEVMNKREASLGPKLVEVLGDKNFENYKKKKAFGPVPVSSLHKDFSKGIVLSDVNLRWSQEYKSFYSKGNIYVSNIGKEDIGKAMPGYVEIRKTPKGDIITLYLQTTPESWYFITYDDNRVAVLSSSSELNTSIGAKSKGEMPDRSKLYYVLASAVEKVRFINAFKERYLGIENAEEEELPVDDAEEHKEEKEETISDPSKDSEDPSTENEEEEEESNVKKQPAKDKGKNNKKAKKDDKKKFDQYKLPNQDLDFENEEKEEKQQPSLDDHKKSQQDQQKIKDLFK
ncbi:MAG: hypothetical protein ACK40G_07265 [Cytophagaceae bacterium]